ncbi:MAG: MFS transporter [Candidatus Roizmanbacteria bacterium]|nr:MFS transporter [Candidatus Roizmanbacteria bacterium]
MNKNIRLLTWFNFFTDFSLYAPVAVIYFSQVAGSFALGMAVFSLIMVSSALFEIPTGIFSDKAGRKKTIVLGALVSVLSSVFFAIGISFVFLAIGSVLAGLARSFYSGNNDAYLHDLLSSEKQEHLYDEYLGKTSAMFQVALASSAFLGSIIAYWSFPLVMWLSVIPQILCLLLALRMNEPRVHTAESGNVYAHLKEAVRLFVGNKKIRLLTATNAIGYGFGEAGYQFQAAFYQMVWPLWAIGIAKMFSNIGAFTSFYFSGRIIKKFNGPKILFIGSIYNRIAGTLAVLFPSPVSPLLMSSTSLTYGVASVAENGLMQNEFSSHQRATMGSLNSFIGSIFFGIIAIGIGLFADKLSPAVALLIVQIGLLPMHFLYWRLYSQDKSKNRQ